MNNALMWTSETNEHYTPKELLERVADFYGGILDLDPCSNSKEDPNVVSRFQFTVENDGLAQAWFGKVFVNPPYGRSLKAWAAKSVAEYKTGNCKELLFLAPSRTDTAWYGMLSPYIRCNIRGRLKFINEANQGNSAPFPSVLFYLGDRKADFYDSFYPIGEIVEQVDRFYL